MVLTIILVLFLALIAYLLFMPLVLVIDTRSKAYYVHFRGLSKVSVIGDDNEVMKIKVNILFFNFYYHPFRPNRTTQPKKPKIATSQVRKHHSIGYKTILRLLRSFKVRTFYLNLDTGDCITNARLYPVFTFLNYYKGGFHINFKGQNTLVLVVENKPIRLIRSYINI